jgi:hypothetical protein
VAGAGGLTPREIAAVVRHWDAPDWRGARGRALPNVTRDEDGARSDHLAPGVVQLALPQAASPVPVVMHQHGNPGSQEEVSTTAALPGLAAVIGFTDILNRESWRRPT